MIKRSWVEHGTKIIGVVQGTIAALAGVAGLIPLKYLPILMGVSSVLTFWRGFVNTEILKSLPDDTDQHSGV